MNDDDLLITDRRRIVTNYLSFWFWVDVISTVPVNLLVDAATPTGGGQAVKRQLAGLRLIKMIKLVRLAKLQSFFAKLEADDKIDPSQMRIMKLLIQVRSSSSSSSSSSSLFALNCLP